MLSSSNMTAIQLYDVRRSFVQLTQKKKSPATSFKCTTTIKAATINKIKKTSAAGTAKSGMMNAVQFSI